MVKEIYVFSIALQAVILRQLIIQEYGIEVYFLEFLYLLEALEALARQEKCQDVHCVYVRTVFQ